MSICKIWIFTHRTAKQQISFNKNYFLFSAHLIIHEHRHICVYNNIGVQEIPQLIISDSNQALSKHQYIGLRDKYCNNSTYAY